MGDARQAPGGPGIPGRWTSSAKTGVGTAIAEQSRVWFTVSHGILDEVYFPRVDQACTRDLGLIVTDGKDFFSEEKRDARHEARLLEDGVPAYHLVNTCRQGRYRIEKSVLSDPRRDVVLQWIEFYPLVGTLADYRLYALLAPHLVNGGADNTAWLDDYKGHPMLFAEGDGSALALACSPPWLARSAGFVGTSDGWQDLMRHKVLQWNYERADGGNVALTGEIDLVASGGRCLLALGFGQRAAEAAHRALASLNDGYAAARSGYVAEWHGWQRLLLPLDERPFQTDSSTAGPTPPAHNCYRISTVVLRAHEATTFPGGIIASLSIPWGFNKGDDDLGGYHLVWPRDLAETAGGLLAAGAHDDARRVLDYLQATQEADGHWPQNMWLDGTPYWGGVQMDECAFPILLVDLAYRSGTLDAAELPRYWPMIHQAAAYLVRNGPVTGQDRWEEDGGYSPFTLAVEIAALLAAADLAELGGAGDQARYLRETADCWNDQVEAWTYASGTDTARRLGVAGYYVRIAPPDTADAASPVDGFVPIKNRPPDQGLRQASQIVSPDALALVRFGLRAPDDPRILDTVRVIDDLLKVETPAGPVWRRYNGDGYGEHEDGRPFDSTGVGRPWPLLAGERAHYELAAGRADEARRLLETLESTMSKGGMIPEQVWDLPDIPERELFFGEPTGSAMPLVWAHAEHVKLLRSLREGRVFDMPIQPVQRYQVEKVTSPFVLWCWNHRIRRLVHGKALRLVVCEPAIVRWSVDDWATVQDLRTQATGLGVDIAELPVSEVAPGGEIVFTFFWLDDQRWEGSDYRIAVDTGEAATVAALAEAVTARPRPPARGVGEREQADATTPHA